MSTKGKQREKGCHQKRGVWKKETQSGGKAENKRESILSSSPIIFAPCVGTGPTKIPTGTPASFPLAQAGPSRRRAHKKQASTTAKKKRHVCAVSRSRERPQNQKKKAGHPAAECDCRCARNVGTSHFGQMYEIQPCNVDRRAAECDRPRRCRHTVACWAEAVSKRNNCRCTTAQ